MLGLWPVQRWASLRTENRPPYIHGADCRSNSRSGEAFSAFPPSLSNITAITSFPFPVLMTSVKPCRASREVMWLIRAAVILHVLPHR